MNDQYEQSCQYFRITASESILSVDSLCEALKFLDDGIHTEVGDVLQLLASLTASY